MASLDSLTLWLLAALIPLVLAAGVCGYQAWASRAAGQPQRIPSRWPLRVRTLVNSEELRVWRWLKRAFPESDLHIMIKMPVTRFTLPSDRAMAESLHQMLGNVYCTFTICTGKGEVLGCVDVAGRRRITDKNYEIKHTLLSQCGLRYELVEAARLPSVAGIREEFLSRADMAQTLVEDRVREDDRMTAAQANLRSALSRQRQNRGNSDFGALSSYDPLGDDDDERFQTVHSSWGANSFLQSLDSRKGELT